MQSKKMSVNIIVHNVDMNKMTVIKHNNILFSKLHIE